MSSDPGHILARKLKFAKASIAWERLLERLFPGMMIAGLVLLVILSGVFFYIPVWLKFSLFGVAGIAFVFSLGRLRNFKWPQEDDALARIERRSGKKHRPATSWTDTLSDQASATPEQKALWQAHRKRMAEQLNGLKAGAPRSPLPRLDQNAMRNALAVALIAAAVLTLGSWQDRLQQAVATTAPSDAIPVTLDAWLNPPAYTAKAPVLLTKRQIASQSDATTQSVLTAPENSELVVRINGAGNLSVTLLDPTSANAETPDVLQTLSTEPSTDAKEADKPQVKNASAPELRTKLTTSAVIVAQSDGNELGRWSVNIIADEAPVATIPEPINITPSAAFSLPWKVTDDYGVSSLEGKVSLDKTRLDPENIDLESPFLTEAPDFPVSMQRINPKQAEGRSFQNLAAHPWAGLPVEIILHATDQAGQTGDSDPLRITLPEPNFSNEVARALIEQRKNLFMRPDNQRDVVRVLSTMLVWPDGTIKTSGAYLGIRHAAAQLYQAGTHEEVKAVTDLLWEIAQTIENGNLPEALKKLQAIKKELEKALAEGASEEKIAKLMQQMREAMNEYLQAMREQMQRNQQNQQSQNQRQQNGAQHEQQVRSQDLQRMMDMIENLARSGARDAAQQMLSDLENILQNLQPGQQQQANPQSTSPMARMLDQLSDMMRRQQELMDQTFQLPQQGGQQQSGRQNQGQPLPGQQGQEPGGRGQSDQQTPGSGQLSRQQGDLTQMLERLMEQMQQQGLQTPEGLGQAQQGMDQATGQLGQGNRDEALGSQGEAMRGLQQGARNMAQQLMQQGTGNEGNVGRHGEGRNERRDPLGRPMPSQGEEYGQRENVLPQEAEVERARRILDALRGKANETGRPKLELDYIDRLLKGLY